MLKLNKKESLNLYFYLSNVDELNDELENVLVKLEKEIFNHFSVNEVEKIKLEFETKGIV